MKYPPLHTIVANSHFYENTYSFIFVKVSTNYFSQGVGLSSNLELKPGSIICAGETKK